MKKIYLSFVALFAAALSFGQYDLAVELVDPLAGETVTPVDNLPVSFKIVNNGPDTITSGSKVWFAGFWAKPDFTDGGEFDLADGTENMWWAIGLPQDLTPGNSVTSQFIEGVFATPIQFDISGYEEGTLVGVIIAGVGEDLETLPVPDPNDASPANNMAFFKVGANPSTSIDYNSIAFNVYPNPAKNVLNVSATGLDNGTVSIVAVTGQEVANVNFNGFATLDVSHLNNGVYFYTISDSKGNALHTKKLIIQK